VGCEASGAGTSRNQRQLRNECARKAPTERRDYDVAHKFRIGELVSFKAIGQKLGLYKIIRHMPEEFQAIDWKYRIKSDQEGFERTVLECDLSPSIVPEDTYGPVKPLRRGASHH
jgi:hypothetical protein